MKAAHWKSLRVLLIAKWESRYNRHCLYNVCFDLYNMNLNEFCKKEYGSKLYKLSFNAHMSCPNRDGTIGVGGCIFCSEGGSGDFAIDIDVDENDSNVDAQNGDTERNDTAKKSLDKSICQAKTLVSNKYKGDRFIAYFQAYTNTYAPVERLRKIYEKIISREDIAVLSIATRPDCLSDETIALLKELNEIKPVWVELGLQTTKEESIKLINRGYNNEVYDACVTKLKAIGVHVITHVILYLPGESEEDMQNTVRHVVEMKSDGIKLQLLHVLKNTKLAKMYEEEPFFIPSMDEYVCTVKKCVDLLPEEMVIHRLTGDAPKSLLIEPKWSGNKKAVMNAIKEAINPSGPYYVYILQCEDGSLYTGSTNDIEKRYEKHLDGTGAKYTRAHKPVRIAYSECFKTKSEALRREMQIKKLKRSEKLELIR